MGNTIEDGHVSYGSDTPKELETQVLSQVESIVSALGYLERQGFSIEETGNAESVQAAAEYIGYMSLVEAGRKAAQVLKDKNTRIYLCRALVSVTNDAFEIGKAITPVLVALAAAGTVAIPVNSLLYAAVSVIISRMGVATLCKNIDKEKSA